MAGEAGNIFAAKARLAASQTRVGHWAGRSSLK